MSAAALIADCQKRLERARGGGGWFASGGSQIDHGTYRSVIAPYHDRVYFEGRVAWGALVQANPGLYAPGDWDSTGAVVYSYDRHFDANPQLLERIAASLGALKNAMPKDALLVAFAAEVRNDAPREIDRMAPPALTARRQVRYETIYIQRHRLPTGYLAGQFFPIVISTSQPTQPMLLPLEDWTPELVEAWQSAARKKPPSVRTIAREPGPIGGYAQAYEGGYAHYDVPTPVTPPAPTPAPAPAPRLDTAAEAFAKWPLQLTPAAAGSLKLSAGPQPASRPKVRVSVADNSHRLDFVTGDPNPTTDFVYDSAGVTLVVDLAFAGSLTGVLVDFGPSPQGIGFVFRRVA